MHPKTGQTAKEHLARQDDYSTARVGNTGLRAQKGHSGMAAALHLVATSRKWGRPDLVIGHIGEFKLAQGGKTTT